MELQLLQECYASLSRREREVLGLVVKGRLNKQVAAQLGISEITVKAHRRRVMRKMHRCLGLYRWIARSTASSAVAPFEMGKTWAVDRVPRVYTSEPCTARRRCEASACRSSRDPQWSFVGSLLRN